MANEEAVPNDSNFVFIRRSLMFAGAFPYGLFSLAA